MKKRCMIAAVILMACLLPACGFTAFDGSRTGNTSEFLIEYRVLNQTDSQLLELKEGDILNIEVVSKSGKVDLEVRQENGEVIYAQQDVQTSSFQLAITQSGTYQCAVTGTSAKGSVSFTIANEE